MNLFTIGFTKKTAEQFFETLKKSGVKRIVDIRLNNTSQLAAFAKRDDLIYFLKTICGIRYAHMPKLAPNKELLDLFKKKKGSWSAYEIGYLNLLLERNVDSEFLRQNLRDADCLLCSEHTPERCHRRIVAERFQSAHGGIDIVHL
jgi:uncharacterized protein (DUF488 family)